MQSDRGRRGLLSDTVDARAALVSVLDALEETVALLAADGTILVVNRPWREFGEANGLRMPNYGVGANYIKQCTSAVPPNDENAMEMAVALREVIGGRRTRFSCEYPCHSPDKHRWFAVRVVDLGLLEPRLIVFHSDITETKLEHLKIQKGFARLTNRELEIVHQVIAGHSSADIAERLGVSKRTIDAHRANIAKKTKARNAADLARMVRDVKMN